MKKLQSAAVAMLLGLLALVGASEAYAQTASTTSSGVESVLADSGPASVGSTLETHINNNGTVLVRGAKITSVTGSVINAKQQWGSYSVTWIINTSGSTQLQRRYGGASSLAEFAVGDYLSVSGTLDKTQSVATINAQVVKDFSVQKVNASFSGSVTGVTASTSSFALSTTNRGVVTVLVSSSTVIKQGSIVSNFSALAVGQKISKTEGVWDNRTNTLQAKTVTIYQDQSLLNKRTFEGTVSATIGSTTPTTFTYVVGSATYTVNIATNTQLLSNSWNQLSLSSLKVNDKVRVYGAIEPSSLSTIDAYIVRDTSVK